MKISFPYPGYEEIAPVDVPEANLLGVYVNLVSDKQPKIAGCFAGDPVQAHRAGCELRVN